MVRIHVRHRHSLSTHTHRTLIIKLHVTIHSTRLTEKEAYLRLSCDALSLLHQAQPYRLCFHETEMLGHAKNEGAASTMSLTHTV